MTGRPEEGLASGETAVRGPYFEELSRGQVFGTSPPVTLTDAMAAAHQAIVGERSWLALSHEMAREVLGGGPVAPGARRLPGRCRTCSPS